MFQEVSVIFGLPLKIKFHMCLRVFRKLVG